MSGPIPTLVGVVGVDWQQVHVVHNDTVPNRTTPSGGQIGILEGFEEANVEECTAIEQVTIGIGLEYA